MYRPRRSRRAALLLLLFLPTVAAAASKPDALDREADVYLVPIGSLPRGVLPGLVDYYEKRLGLSVAVTGPLPFEPRMQDEERGQLIAEELLLGMVRGFRGWARNPRALFVGITEHDIYTTDRGWRFAFAVRRGRHLAVVSAARMADPHSPAGVWSPSRVTRLRKMVTKTIAMQHLSLGSSADPASVLYSRVLGLGDLDRMDEATVQRDVVEASKRRRLIEPLPDPDDPLSLRDPIEPSGERDRGGFSGAWLIVSGLVVYFGCLIGYGIGKRRQTRAVWRRLSDRHGWRFVEADGPWYNRGSWRIELEIDGVPVVVDRIEVGSYRSRIQLMRIRGDISCPHDFRIVPVSLFTRIQKQLGRLVDVEVGDPEYDRAYVVVCEADEWLRRHLPAELRRKQLASKAMLFSENGALELRRFPVADHEEDLLLLVQVFADAAAAARERPPVVIAAAPSGEALPSFSPGQAGSAIWAKQVKRGLLAVGAIEALGFFPLQMMIQSERTNAAWGLAAPWAAGLALALGWCLLVSRDRTGSRVTRQNGAAVLVLLPLIFFGYWIFSGPWVMGWNALVGRPHAEGLYGPVIEKRVHGADRGLLVLPHPDEDRRVRIVVRPTLFEEVRPGDPMRLELSQGSLGFFYWLREER